MPFGRILEAVLSTHREPLLLSPTDNLRVYLSEAILPTMVHGSSAPPMPPEGHKAHLNHLAIQAEDYRSRFVKIVAPKDKKQFDDLVLEFANTLPYTKLDLPTVDDSTGYAFTLPAKGFDIQPPSVPRPTNVREVTPWVLTLPLQTMIRALHVALPAARRWDVTYDNRYDPDSALWTTLAWRKTPPPSNIETFFKNPKDPLKNCSVMFAVQPPWILSPQDFKSFVRCTSLPPYNPWDESANRPFTSAERVWGKLWDTCVRMRCHHWVLSTYWGWVFGAFSEGFTAGQILALKSHDAEDPSVLECLVYHVASSIGLVESSKLPQYFETADQLEWDMEIPEPDRDAYVEYSDSGSEWDGMDEELTPSAAVSDYPGYEGQLSAWGSQQVAAGRSMVRIPWLGEPDGFRLTQVHPTQVHDLLKWQEDVGNSVPVPERCVSPAASDSALSTASMFHAARRAGSEIPEVLTVMHNKTFFGSTLKTVIEQGPAEELGEED